MNKKQWALTILFGAVSYFVVIGVFKVTELFFVKWVDLLVGLPFFVLWLMYVPKWVARKIISRFE